MKKEQRPGKRSDPPEMQNQTGRNGGMTKWEMPGAPRKQKKRRIRGNGTVYAAKTDYRVLEFSGREKIRLFLEFTGLLLLADWLFFSRWEVLLFGAFLWKPWLKRVRNAGIKRRKKKLMRDFREALNSLTVSLKAGYSVENAFAEVCRDLDRICGPDADLTKEFRHMLREMRLMVPMEKLLCDFAGRAGEEDLISFAAVFSEARRLGGDMPSIVRETAVTIERKIDVEQEIETSLTAKKMEQKIMSVMPAGIIAYMRLASPGFLDILYSSWAGALVMTGCLAGYAGAVLWAERIVDIRA